MEKDPGTLLGVALFTVLIIMLLAAGQFVLALFLFIVMISILMEKPNL